jgi:hypothetical protein
LGFGDNHSPWHVVAFFAPLTTANTVRQTYSEACGSHYVCFHWQRGCFDLSSPENSWLTDKLGLFRRFNAKLGGSIQTLPRHGWCHSDSDALCVFASNLARRAACAELELKMKSNSVVEVNFNFNFNFN